MIIITSVIFFYWKQGKIETDFETGKFLLIRKKEKVQIVQTRHDRMGGMEESLYTRI